MMQVKGSTVPPTWGTHCKGLAHRGRGNALLTFPSRAVTVGVGAELTPSLSSCQGGRAAPPVCLSRGCTSSQLLSAVTDRRVGGTVLVPAHCYTMWGAQQGSGPGMPQGPGCNFPGTALQSEPQPHPLPPPASLREVRPALWSAGAACLLPPPPLSFTGVSPVNLLHV